MFSSTMPVQSLYGVAALAIGAIYGMDISLSGLITISALLRLLALSFKVLAVLHGGPRPGISAKALVLEIISLSCRLASSTTCEGYLPSDFTGDFIYQVIDMLSLLVALWLLRRALILTPRKQTEDLEFDIIQAVLLSATVAALCHARENLVPLFDALWLMGYVSGALALVPEYLRFASTSSAGMSIHNKHSALVSFASWAAHIPLMAFYVLEYPLFDFSTGETFGWPVVAVNVGSVALYFGFLRGYEASGPLHSFIHWTGVARSRRLEFPKSLRTSSLVSSAVLCLCGMLFMPLKIRTQAQAQEHRYAAILLKLSVVFANVAFYTKDSRWKPSNAAVIFTRRLTSAGAQLVQGFNFAALRVAAAMGLFQRWNAGLAASGEDAVVKRKRKCSTWKGNAESHATDPTQRKANAIAHKTIQQDLCEGCDAAEISVRRSRAGNCKGPTISRCDEDIGVQPESTFNGTEEISVKEGSVSEIGDTADPARITVEEATPLVTAPPKVDIHIGNTDETLTTRAYFGEVEIDVKSRDKVAGAVLVKEERGDEESWTSAPTSDSSDDETKTSERTVESDGEDATMSVHASLGYDEFTTQPPSAWEFEEEVRRVGETSVQLPIFLDPAPHGAQWFTDGERDYEPVQSPTGKLFYTDGKMVFDAVCIPIEAGQGMHVVAEDGCATFKPEGGPRVGIQEVQSGAAEDA
jgi:hypothetical protein